MIQKSFVMLTVICLFTAGSMALAQGPLTPPGTPAPNYKTLQQIEPRTPVNTLAGNSTAVHAITASGSYYLTANIVGEVGKDGIQVKASNVVIDLNGFSLIGITNSDTGILADADMTDIVIRNGTIKDWDERGINLEAADNCSVEKIHASNNAGTGIHGGDQSRVVDCVTEGNLGGVYTGTDGMVKDCVVSASIQHGIAVSFGSNIINCNVTGSVADGIRADVGSRIEGCIVRNSGDFGIRLLSQLINRDPVSIVRNCVVTFNTDGGIRTAGNALILNNTINEHTTVNESTPGIELVDEGSRIEGNHISNNEVAIKSADQDAIKNIVIRNTFYNNQILVDVETGNAIAPTTSDPSSALADNALVNVGIAAP